MDNRLTALQAFKAMVSFLDYHYHKTLSDDLGSLLGDLQLFEDGSGTGDPAAWHDWIEVFGNDPLTRLQAFKAMYHFIENYYIRTSATSTDLRILLDHMQSSNNHVIDAKTWQLWIDCVDKIVGDSKATR